MFVPFVENNFATSQVKMLVLGRPHARMSDTSKSFTLEALVEANTEYAKLVKSMEEWRYVHPNKIEYPSYYYMLAR
jgi:hypothetical protein